MNRIYDFIVVWWWISWASFSFNLDKNYSILVLEKSEFPREKLCWWLLTWKTIKLLKEIYWNDEITKVINNYISSYSIFNDKLELLSKKESNKLDLCLSKRIDLDNFMYEQIKNKENINIINSEVINVKWKKVETKKWIFYWKSIIFCDWANWYGVKLNKKINKQFISWLKVDLDKKKFNINWYDNHLEIYFNKKIKWYIWIFSYSDIINIWIWWNSWPELSNLLVDFIKNKFNLSQDEYKIKWHPVPINNFWKKIKIWNYYFLWDSIWFVDAITWEWIYYWIKSWYKLAKLFNKWFFFAESFYYLYFLNDILNIKISHLLKDILFWKKYDILINKLKNNTQLTNIFHNIMVLNIPYFLIPFHKLFSKIFK